VRQRDRDADPMMFVTRCVSRSVTARAALLLAVACLLCSCAGPAPEPRMGRWRAWLLSPGGELPFELEFERDRDGIAVFVVNGLERIRVPRFETRGSEVAFAFEPYDSSISATLSEDGKRLAGAWRKTTGADTESRLPFHAAYGPLTRFPRSAEGGGQTARVRLDGRWAVKFSTSDDPAVGVFQMRRDDTVWGTFMTTTGDYRYLAGSLDGDRLRLSCFDGAHAFLFDARLRTDDSLEGDFWSRDNWHETWTAERDPEAALPDAFGLTHWVEGGELSRLVFPDLTGRLMALDDPEFSGRARIVEIFGSWCPNCNDAARFLVEMDRRYRDRGLSILGLAFEMTGDFDRDAEQVRRFAAHHGIEYPLLVAGTSDKAEASATLTLVDEVRSYPTTIFLDRSNRVRAVHQGYTGPATGESHDELRRRFESLVEELLE
jgi:thiol-disulfide isomerase/thioredoxin